jgi:hypothetical protein
MLFVATAVGIVVGLLVMLLGAAIAVKSSKPDQH